jgi:hypothetical protein
MNMESHGGMIWTGENRRTRRKTCPSATLSTTNPDYYYYLNISILYLKISTLFSRSWSSSVSIVSGYGLDDRVIEV